MSLLSPTKRYTPTATKDTFQSNEQNIFKENEIPIPSYREKVNLLDKSPDNKIQDEINHQNTIDERPPPFLLKQLQKFRQEHGKNVDHKVVFRSLEEIGTYFRVKHQFLTRLVSKQNILLEWYSKQIQDSPPSTLIEHIKNVFRIEFDVLKK